jgi:hypothetical protein
MSPTVVGLLASYGPRLGPYVGLADLNDALACSLRELGLPPAGATVVDADLVAVDPADWNQFDDVAMARAYETILNNLTDDLLREAGVGVKADDVRPGFERRLARLEAKLKDKYGVGLPVPSTGTIALDFQARGDDTVADLN